MNVYALLLVVLFASIPLAAVYGLVRGQRDFERQQTRDTEREIE